LRKFLNRNSAHVTLEEIHRLRTTIRKLEAAVDAVLAKPSRRERALLRERPNPQTSGQDSRHGRFNGFTFPHAKKGASYF
jgi:hypothetical protein